MSSGHRTAKTARLLTRLYGKAAPKARDRRCPLLLTHDSKADPVSDREVEAIMNHKRGRARNRRAGCKLCKPWKVNGIRTERLGGEKHSDHVRRMAAREMAAG